MLLKKLKAVYIEHGRRVAYFEGERNNRQMFTRYLVEKNLGKKLRSNEHVHHIDGDRLNDRLENLKVLGIKEHSSLHSTGKVFVERRKRVNKECQWCGINYEVKESLKTKSVHCSIECRKSYERSCLRSDKKDKNCPECGQIIQRRSSLCRKCANIKSLRIKYYG